MENLADYKKGLEQKIKMSLAGGWCGDLSEYAEFIRTALTKHLYDVMNTEDKRFKPTFEEWENFMVNNENLVDMLHQLHEYQENEDFRLMNIFESA